MDFHIFLSEGFVPFDIHNCSFFSYAETPFQLSIDVSEIGVLKIRPVFRLGTQTGILQGSHWPAIKAVPSPILNHAKETVKNTSGCHNSEAAQHGANSERIMRALTFAEELRSNDVADG